MALPGVMLFWAFLALNCIQPGEGMVQPESAPDSRLEVSAADFHQMLREREKMSSEETEMRRDEKTLGQCLQELKEAKRAAPLDASRGAAFQRLMAPQVRCRSYMRFVSKL